MKINVVRNFFELQICPTNPSVGLPQSRETIPSEVFTANFASWGTGFTPGTLWTLEKSNALNGMNTVSER
jgi:hypothetical protein